MAAYFDEIEFLLQELFIIDRNGFFEAKVMRYNSVKSETNQLIITNKRILK